MYGVCDFLSLGSALAPLVINSTSSWRLLRWNPQHLENASDLASTAGCPNLLSGQGIFLDLVPGRLGRRSMVTGIAIVLSLSATSDVVDDVQYLAARVLEMLYSQEMPEAAPCPLHLQRLCLES